MATYTLTNPDVDEPLLDAIVSQHNAQNGTSLTKAEYLQARFDALMNEAKIKDRDRRWDALSQADKDAALAAVSA